MQKVLCYDKTNCILLKPEIAFLLECVTFVIHNNVKICCYIMRPLML